MDIRFSPDFSKYFEMLVNPIKKILFLWANSFQKASIPGKILWFTLSATFVTYIYLIPAMLLETTYNNTILGTFISDVFDISDNGVIEWWEMGVVPISFIWFFILSGMALLVFLLAKGKGFFVGAIRPSGGNFLEDKTVNEARKAIANALEKAFNAVINAIPARKSGEKVLILKGAKFDRYVEFARSILMFPLRIFAYAGGKLKNLNMSSREVYMSTSDGSISEIKK